MCSHWGAPANVNNIDRKQWIQNNRGRLFTRQPHASLEALVSTAVLRIMFF